LGGKGVAMKAAAEGRQGVVKIRGGEKFRDANIAERRDIPVLSALTKLTTPKPMPPFINRHCENNREVPQVKHV